MNNLYVYKSSAGSGKTYALVFHYLWLVLQNPNRYKQILAVTFTNKATAEMKSRIVEALHTLAIDKHAPLALDLAPKLPNTDIQKTAQIVLGKILHNFGRFNVQTLESFFNYVVRSFSRELNIQLQTQLELDQDKAIRVSVDQMIEDALEDTELTRWLIEYQFNQVDEAKSWNILPSLIQFGKDVFKERTDLLFENKNAREAWSIQSAGVLQKKLYQQIQLFESTLADMALKALRILETFGIDVLDCRGGKNGVGVFLQSVSLKKRFEPTDTFRSLTENEDAWYPKTSKLKNEFRGAIANGLGRIPREMVAYYDENCAQYDAAKSVLSTIYAAPLLSYIHNQLLKYRDTNRILFISDLGKLLSAIMKDQDTPFIYEKLGNQLKYFLLDEFQDTSSRQWQNIAPLVTNSLSNGHNSFIVGDAKQSIYRWRNSDFRLLMNLENDVSLLPFKSIFRQEKLNTNYRSGANIVWFNNIFFGESARAIETLVGDKAKMFIDEMYSETEIHQKTIPSQEGAGCVKILFLNSEGDTWKKKALEALYQQLGDVLNRGYAYSDIAILVRKNSEAIEIVEYFGQNVTHSFPIVSSEALLVQNNMWVQIIIDILEWLAFDKNDIPKAHILFCIQLHQKLTAEEAKIKFGELDKLKNRFTTLPLYECTEEIMEWLQPMPAENAYVLRFLEFVLNTTQDQALSIQSFLQLWEEEKDLLSVLHSDTTQAIRVMTFHKAKGLEFPVVFIPFAEWSFSPKSTQNLIWASSDQPPYNTFEAIPISPKSNFTSDSPFYAAYLEEYAASYADNINLLYVALTRPKDAIYIYAPQKNNEKKEQKEVTAASLIHHIVTTSTFFPAHVSQDNSTFYFGKETQKQDVLNRKTSTENIHKPQAFFNPSGAWRRKLVIRSKKEDNVLAFSTHYSTSNAEPRLQGLIIHKILAFVYRVQTVDADLRKAFETTELKSLIPEAEQSIYIDWVKSFVQKPELKPFFETEMKIYNERSLVLKDAKTLRPDRILMGKNEVTIIEYKTGAPTDAHLRQLQGYMTLFENTAFEKVEGFVVYVPDGNVKNANA